VSADDVDLRDVGWRKSRRFDTGVLAGSLGLPFFGIGTPSKISETCLCNPTFCFAIGTPP